MHYESADYHQVTGYVRGEDAKAQESYQVDHARDYTEQGRKPLLKYPVIRNPFSKRENKVRTFLDCHIFAP
jgi:hypothetical protein